MTEPRRTAADAPLPGGDFRLLIQRFGYQALIALGVLENPVTGERSTNRANARAVLDDLLMLREKTAGNLNADEADHLDKVISDLHQAFDRVARRGDPA